MSEIILTDDQIEDLANRVAEKVLNLMKEQEDKKIKQSISNASLDRQGRAL